MAYSLTEVKKIQVLSRVDEEIITTTLNPKLKINESAEYSNVTSAINALYRLSDLSPYDIVLTRELSIKRNPISYVPLDDTEKWYTGTGIGTVGNSITHEIQFNTLDNVITAKFNVPSILTNVAIGEATLESGNKVLLTITFYKAFSSIQSTDGYLYFFTPNGRVNIYVNMHINKNEPEEEQTGGI